MNKFHLSIACNVNIRQVNQFEGVKEKLFIVVHLKQLHHIQKQKNWRSSIMSFHVCYLRRTDGKRRERSVRYRASTQQLLAVIQQFEKVKKNNRKKTSLFYLQKRQPVLFNLFCSKWQSSCWIFSCTINYIKLTKTSCWLCYAKEKTTTQKMYTEKIPLDCRQ